ncbi:MAG: hypothetical protein R3B90_18640 [Planctomycetaceae bacterium]
MAGIGMGAIELVLMLLMGGGPLLAPPLGLPPGERDGVLQRTPPDGCLFYLEWAGRSSGELGGAGIDGMVADPEMTQFVESVETAIVKSIENDGGGEGQVVAAELPALVKTLLRRPGCLFISFSTDDLPERGDDPNLAVVFERLKVGIVYGLGDEADATQQRISRLSQLGGLELPADLDEYVLPIPVPGGGVKLHQHDDYLIAAYGAETLATITAGLSSERPGLLEDQRVSAAFKEVEFARTGQWTWLDIAGWRRAVDSAAGNAAMIAEVTETLGLHQVDYIASAAGVDEEGQVVSRMRLKTDGGQAGLLAVFSGRPLQPQDFAHIPADADLFIGKSVNATNLLEAVRQIVVSSDPELGEQFDGGLQAIESVLGLQLQDELFAAFGDVWTVYDSPGAGGVLLTAPVMAVEVRDPELAYRVFTQLMTKLKGAMPNAIQGGRRRRGVFLEQQKFLDRTVYYINTIGDDVPVAPSFCVTDTHLLFALHPQPIKAHLRFVASDAPGLDGPLAAGSAVSEHSLMYYGSADAEQAARITTTIAPWVGQLLFSELQREGIPLDIFSMPSARALLPYCSDGRMQIAVDDAGILWESRDGIPLLSLVGGGTRLLPLLVISGVRVTVPNEVFIQEAAPAEVQKIE